MRTTKKNSRIHHDKAYLNVHIYLLHEEWYKVELNIVLLTPTITEDRSNWGCHKESTKNRQVRGKEALYNEFLKNGEPELTRGYTISDIIKL